MIAKLPILDLSVRQQGDECAFPSTCYAHYGNCDIAFAIRYRRVSHSLLVLSLIGLLESDIITIASSMVCLLLFININVNVIANSI